VRNVVAPSGDWDYNFLTSSLPSSFAFQVLATPVPKDTDGQDSIGWGGTNTRDFTVKSTYDSLNTSAQSVEGD
jgi:hypothetical protein